MPRAELSGRKARMSLRRNRYLGRSGTSQPGRYPLVTLGGGLSNRLIARTLTALIILNAGSAAHAQRVVDEGTVVENVTLISPERIAPLTEIGGNYELDKNVKAPHGLPGHDAPRGDASFRADTFSRTAGA